MSDPGSSSTAQNCLGSRNDEDESKQSVLKKFFIDVQAKQPNSWCGKCLQCSQSVSDTYGTTSNFVRHMRKKHSNLYEKWLVKKNVNTDNK
jgi:hypothetical protein